MKRAGAARREVLIRLCPPQRPVIDVGADHGHVAARLGGIATERAPNRMGRPDVRWVVADGLLPFRSVPVAVIAGMGAATIEGILTRGPRPDAVVLHAADDPPRLRRWLAAHGWCIDAEALAPEAGRFAEVIRALPGHEPATGPWLALGPRLLEGDDPHLGPHLEHLRRWYAHIEEATRGRAPEKHREAAARRAFVEERLRERA